MVPTPSTVVSSIVFAMAASVVVCTDTSVVQTLIDTADTHVFYLDLHLRRRSPSNSSPNNTSSVHWFEGFGETMQAGSAAAAVATLSHPIRRMLSFLLKEEVGLEEALFWTEGQGEQGYQLLDNYLVRVLAGQSTWELPPGAVGEAEFHNAKIALGKFEVLLRADCLAVDLPLLGPYIGRVFSAHNALEITSAGSDAEVSPVLTPGPIAESLIRRNRWDLQLWDYAESLIMSRSTTLDSYLCSKQTWATKERQPGTGRRAAVFNSPDFHATSLAMFSCVLVSWGFHVTAIVQERSVLLLIEEISHVFKSST